MKRFTEAQIRKFLPDSGDVVHVRGMKDIRPGTAFLKAVERMRDDARYQTEVKGKLSDTVNEDLRFHLGRVAALNDVLQLPDDVREFIDKVGEQ